MELGFALIGVLFGVICGVIGYRIGRTKSRRGDPQGFLYVYEDKDTGKPSLYLDCHISTVDLITSKHVTFGVINVKPNSHE